MRWDEMRCDQLLRSERSFLTRWRLWGQMTFAVCTEWLQVKFTIALCMTNWAYSLALWVGRGASHPLLTITCCIQWQFVQCRRRWLIRLVQRAAWHLAQDSDVVKFLILSHYNLPVFDAVIVVVGKKKATTVLCIRRTIRRPIVARSVYDEGAKLGLTENNSSHKIEI